MDAADVIEIIQQGFWSTLVICGPPLLAGSAVGLLIAFFQALTQIQEMTLTFVPKFIAIFLAVLVCMPLSFHALGQYTAFLSDKIVRGF